MNLRKQGKPVRHLHECSPERKGQQITKEELHDFALKTLMEEYRIAGHEIMAAGQPDQADFKIKTGCGQVNVKLFVRQELGDLHAFDRSWIMERYRQYGEFPRIAVAFPFCVETQDNKVMHCGCHYTFTYSMFSLIPGDEYDDSAPTDLSEPELVGKYAEAWQKLDAGIILPYLSTGFCYGSDWVFDEMAGRKEYESYFRGKLDCIRRTGGRPEVTPVRERESKECGLFMKQGDVTTYLKMKFEKGRISEAHMSQPISEYEIINTKGRLGQTHGDHLSAVLGQDSIHDALRHMSTEMKLAGFFRTNTSSLNMKDKRTDLICGRIGEGDITVRMLNALDRPSGDIQLVSAFPVLAGRSLDVTIDRVIEWDNQAEATVLCSIGDFEFAFFATDYAKNKWRYRKAGTLNVSLAALAYTVEEGQHTLTLEADKVAGFLAKMGREPEYDENGEIKPLEIGLEQMVTFMTPHDDYPDDAEFHSPCGSVESLEFRGKEFIRTDIVISRRDEDISIPLYFLSDMLPFVTEGMPLAGWLWVSGELTDQSASMTVPKTPSEIFADEADTLTIHMQDFDAMSFDSLAGITDKLAELHIRPGYELDAFGIRTPHGDRLQTYMRVEKATYRWNSVEPYQDHMRIHGSAFSEQDAAKVPQNVLSYVSAGFTPKALSQVWLLDNLTYLMHVHDLDPAMLREYIFYRDRVDEIFFNPLQKDAVSPHFNDACRMVNELGADGLLPALSMDDDTKTATLTYHYWNRQEGLVRVTEVAEFAEGRFTFRIVSVTH